MGCISAKIQLGWVDVLGLKKGDYDISGNAAATDTPARGVHVNVTGDGLPKKGGHISIVLGAPNKDGSITIVTTAPADKATRDLSDNQFKKASEATNTYLDDPTNVSRLLSQADGALDMKSSIKDPNRLAEIEQVQEILKKHDEDGTNPMCGAT